MPKATILYVEDEENDVLFMRLAVREVWGNLSLKSVGDGKEAIAYLSGREPYADRSTYPVPEIILLDLNLPLVSGFEVLAWVRREPSYDHVPVIILSSSGRPEDRARAAALRADDYFTKPASGADFRGIVRTLRERFLSASPSGLTRKS